MKKHTSILQISANFVDLLLCGVPCEKSDALNIVVISY